MTRKLHLALDALEIEAFETTPRVVKGTGTVDAHGTQTPTANSGGSCFDESCRIQLCATDYRCPTNRANCTYDSPTCIGDPC